tara:strand:- start:3 stop:1688 length:1686 start_codon:yes stop_codon:yes gene_type:complete
MNKRLIIAAVTTLILLSIVAVFFLFSEQKDSGSTVVSGNVYSSDKKTIAEGKNLFMQNCAACHGINQDGIGPPLGGITKLLSKDELIHFIQNPAEVIKSGNLRANYFNNKYKSLMPPMDYLTSNQITNVLSYINQQTNDLNLQPILIDTTKHYSKDDRVIAPIEHSGLVIELEDYIRIPLQKDRTPKKGIATLRAHPNADKTLFVSDQMGVIYKVNNAVPKLYLNVRDRIKDFVFEPGIGTGLGSFALHPDFLNNGLIYTTHAEKYAGKPAINEGVYLDAIGGGLQWVLTEWTLKDIKANQFEGKKREVLRFTTPTTAHGAQDIGFAPVKDKTNPDYGMLYMGIGDGGSINLKMPELSHNIKSLLGTIIRIDPRGTNSKTGQYGIPKDNPFANVTDPEVKKEIYAYGFRNPHRMCWDMTYGKRMIVADVGESNVEEINIIEKGGDYGWSTIEGIFGIDIMTDTKVVFEVDDDYLLPYHLPFGQIDHTDNRAISGGFVYKGPIKKLKGKYVFGDIVTGKLFYMNMDKDLTDSKIYDLTIIKNGQVTGVMVTIQSFWARKAFC